MGNKTNSVKSFISEQVRKLEHIRTEGKEIHVPVITVCMEPGSGGSIIGQNIAGRLGMDFFHREIIHEIAQSGKLSEKGLEAVEKGRLSGIQDFIASLTSDHYLWPGLYLEHLTKVVEAIEKRGNAVIVGRGTNFIISSKKCLSVRVVAPLEIRVQHVANSFGASAEHARQRILNRESKRGSFVKRSFHEDITDPLNYDLVINTGRLTIEEAVDAVSLFYLNKFCGA